MSTILFAGISLRPCTLDLYEAIFAGEASLSAFLGVRIARDWTYFGYEPMKSSLKKLQENPAEYIWWTYLIIHQADQMLIGSCGFKGPPDQDGEVEIGYEIAPDYQNRGLATQTARALIQFAFSFPEVRAVKAHTLAFNNASVSVLKKCNLHFVHTLFDPDDGEIWQWKIKRP